MQRQVRLPHISQSLSSSSLHTLQTCIFKQNVSHLHTLIDYHPPQLPHTSPSIFSFWFRRCVWMAGLRSGGSGGCLSLLMIRAGEKTVWLRACWRLSLWGKRRALNKVLVEGFLLPSFVVTLKGIHQYF